MTREQFYNEGIEKINAVYEIFKDYYEESRVDLQNVISKETFLEKADNDNNLQQAFLPFIIVHFPEVTISNEFNDSTTIKDLWAKVTLTYKGTIYYGFALNRSNYPITHWISDYMHSHISGIPKNNITNFLSPCLGTGPIRDTISSLSHSNDSALWSLFCRELDVYTRTESISGGPYRRITNIGNHSSSYQYISSFSNSLNYDFSPLNNNDILKDFITYIIRKRVLKFNFSGSYGIAMDWYEYYITISNVFIEWYNLRYNEGKVSYSLATLLNAGIIHRIEVKDRKIYRLSNNTFPNIGNNAKVLTFKGRDILLEIVEENSQIYHTILDARLSTAILRCILTIINYKYGRENNTDITERFVV